MLFRLFLLHLLSGSSAILSAQIITNSADDAPIETSRDTLRGLVLRVETVWATRTNKATGKTDTHPTPIPRLDNAWCVRTYTWPCPNSNVPCLDKQFYLADTGRRIPEEDVLLFKIRAYVPPK
jgi:hypothetical protein